MHRYSKFLITNLIASALSLLPWANAFGEEADTASIRIKRVAEGLVVIATTNLVKQDEIAFGCNQDGNEIIVDLPVEDELPIVKSLLQSPLVTRNGVSASELAPQRTKRIRIVPTLKLYCDEMKLVSKFQRYVSYSYPAGRELRLGAVEVTGFDFDDQAPRSQVKGAVALKFAAPPGEIDLAKGLKVADNRLCMQMNPRDISNQEILATLFPAKGLTVSTTPSEGGGYCFEFQTVAGADIGKISAKIAKGTGSSEVRIDITLSVALNTSGRKFYERGETNRALRYLEAAKGENGLALAARMSMGTIHWNDERFAEASRSFGELIEMDRSWEFPEARYYAAKAYYQTNKRLNFELSNRLKEFLRRCDRGHYATCDDARELYDEVNEPPLKLSSITRGDMKKLVALLADPKQNVNEVQKNVFHYWATWCPVCLEEMPRIMKYAVAHPNVNIYIVAKHDNQKAIFNTLIKSGAIRRKNIFYYIDSKDDMLLRQMVPLVLANKEPVTPLPISVFLQREVPFYLTDSLNWADGEISDIWRLRYRE